jgi:hypothetical protein
MTLAPAAAPAPAPGLAFVLLLQLQCCPSDPESFLDNCRPNLPNVVRQREAGPILIKTAKTFLPKEAPCESGKSSSIERLLMVVD